MSIATTAVNAARASAKALATEVPPPVLFNSATYARLVPGAKKAVAFMAKLAPPVDLMPGLNIGKSVEYVGLSKTAQQVVDVFGAARFYVESQGLKYGALKEGTAMSRVLLGGREGLHPSQLDHALKQVIGNKDAAAVLKQAAKDLPANSALKGSLEEAAATWRSRAKDPGYRAAMAMRPVEYPQPQRLVMSDRALRAEAEAVARVRADRLEQATSQAAEEWSRAPRSRGWGPDTAMKDLVKSTDWSLRWPVDDVRAWTKEQWIAFRVKQLTQA